MWCVRAAAFSSDRLRSPRIRRTTSPNFAATAAATSYRGGPQVGEGDQAYPFAASTRANSDSHTASTASIAGRSTAALSSRFSKRRRFRWKYCS